MGHKLSARALARHASVTSSPALPALPTHASFKAYLGKQRPELPVHALRPHALRAAASWFVTHFPGTPLYAVKCNPEPLVIQQLALGGIRHFDVASLPEIELVATHAPDAELFFMHPVKSRLAIRRAYFDFGVRHYSLDSHDELQKILTETGNATDLHLHVRLALPKGEAFHALSNKFGAKPDKAISLMRAIRAAGAKVGLCFHVGSQTLTPAPYVSALQLAEQLVQQADVGLDSLDVGGGYPVAYPGHDAAPMMDFMAAIRDTLTTIDLPAGCMIYGEPGRALVAEAGSLLVRVELRKGDAVYINDGVYGSLFDAGLTGLIHPVRVHYAVKREPPRIVPQADFTIYGPTCDSMDTINGYRLPADIAEGDYIEFGQTGSYTAALQSKFNGFYSDDMILLMDQPQLKTKGYWAK